MSKSNEQSFQQDTKSKEIVPYFPANPSQQQKMYEKGNPCTLTTVNESLSENEVSHEYISPLAALEPKRVVPQYGQSKKEIPNNRRPPPVKIDSSLPPEIAALFKANSCDLCIVKLNSRFQSKSHYEGKPHAKKLKKKVEAHTAKEAENSSEANSREERLSPPPLKKKKFVEDKSQLYCKCCDLSFTSTDHATQHYLGRNHHRVLHGLKPLKAGYYNKETDKWQRMPPDPRTPTEQLSGCEDSSAYTPKGRFFCELCSVATTSQEQLDNHLKGQKHTKAQQRASTSNAISTENSDKSKSVK